MIKTLTSFGGYPLIKANIVYPEKHSILNFNSNANIPRGLGRSYGDSALATNILSTKKLTRFIKFDKTSGVLTCDAGVSLAEILKLAVPYGWFLPVTPGTKFVTVGGAIASDVHGKNHHNYGCFSQCINYLKLQIVDNTYYCSNNTNKELFYASCGGMGLTGLITEVELQLHAINSTDINQTIIKVNNLEQLLTMFTEHSSASYSVAWIDCLAKKNSLGKSLLMLGEHANTDDLKLHQQAKINIPFALPICPLTKTTIKAFNYLYYHKQLKSKINNTVHYNTFFYPLDGINNWNYLYGKQGFTQYQLVVPKAHGLEALTAILTQVANSQHPVFLAVLKEFGNANNNLLSFPIKGYTLSLDFKINDNLFDFLNKLDDIVSYYGGRVYLTKDVRLNEQMFKRYYPKWQQFQKIRNKYNANKYFNSLQSQRIGL
jgi:FAD/FMN-containing dehydrogenase